MGNWWAGQRVIDSVELESRFSNEDGMAFMDAVVNEEMTEEGTHQLERVREVLDMLPPREADFIDLYYFKQIKQTDIAALFGVSQPTVCYRLQRAASRIQFLLTLPDVKLDARRLQSTGVVSDPIDVQILLMMVQTTCQSEVAKQLGKSQGFVRHRFMRSVEKLRRVPGMEEYVAVFDKVAANLNILREVQRPTWDSGAMMYVLM